MQIELDGTRRQRAAVRLPRPTGCATACAPQPARRHGKYNGYTMEVVQQIGSDSFDPGHGVLITKTKNGNCGNCGSSSCFVWVIDSHPEDINHVDFVAPDGTPKMATLGDERQLNDASFNAGLDSGSSYEWTDEPNRLHFYVVDKTTDAQGILHYKVAVKSLDGAGPQTRGVALQAAPAAEVAGRPVVDVHVPAQEHGRGGRDRPGAAPAGRDRVPDERRLPPLGRGHRHRLERQDPQRADRRQVRRARSRSRSTSPRRDAAAGGTVTLTRDVGERPDQDRRPRSAASATATSAAPCRRRSR